MNLLCFLEQQKIRTHVQDGYNANLLRERDRGFESMRLKLRLLLVSIVPPRNDCGVRIVLHRHLVERNPFDLHVASNADFADGLLIHTQLRLPRPIYRLRKSRFGPRLATWITDYENLIWPLTANRALEDAVQHFKPHIILTLAECGLCHTARKTAQRHSLPLAGLFLDWFPMMRGHYGHKSMQAFLSRRYRELYAGCDLAFCTSEGMQEMLGPHPTAMSFTRCPAHIECQKSPGRPSTENSGWSMWAQWKMSMAECCV